MPWPAPTRLPPLPGSRAGEGEGGRPRAGTCPQRPAAARSGAAEGGRRARPAGRGASLPARGEALCHLVLVVLRRGKERWGDGRGDSGSGRPPSARTRARPARSAAWAGPPGFRAQSGQEEGPLPAGLGAFPWLPSHPAGAGGVALLSAVLGLSR